MSAECGIISISTKRVCRSATAEGVTGGLFHLLPGANFPAGRTAARRSGGIEINDDSAEWQREGAGTNRGWTLIRLEAPRATLSQRRRASCSRRYATNQLK